MKHLPKITANREISIQDAAEMLGVSTKTLRRWEDRGFLHPIRTVGGHRRYNLFDLYQFKKPKKNYDLIEDNNYDVNQKFLAEEAKKSDNNLEKNNEALNNNYFTDTNSYAAPNFSKLDISVRKFQLPSLPKIAISKSFFGGFLAILILIIGLIYVLPNTSDIYNQKNKLANLTLGFSGFKLPNIQLFNQQQKTASNTNQPQVLAESDILQDITFEVNVPAIINDDITITNGNILTTSETGNIFNTIATALNIGGQATTLSIGGTTGTATINNANLNIAGNNLISPGDLRINPGGGGTSIGTGTAGTIDQTGGDFFVTGDFEIDGTSYIPTLSINGDTFTDLTGSGLEISSGTLSTTLGTTIASGEIENDSIIEDDLKVSNSASNGQILTYNSSTGGFTWSSATSAVINIQNNDVAVGTDVDTLDFDTLFTISASPANEANVTIAANAITATQLASTLTFADGDFVDFSAIAHDDAAAQGIKLPQATTHTAISGGGEGYIAWDTDDNTLKVFDGTSWANVGGAFTLSGDSGSDQSLNAGDTIEISGGTNGIDTVTSATDILTINLDTTEIGTTTFGSGSNFTWTFDGSAGTDPTLAFADGTITGTLSSTGLFNVLTGNLKVGNGTPGLSLNGEDAYIEGTFEVDGQTQIDGNIDATSGIDITGANLTVGTTQFTVSVSNGDITSAGDIAVNGGDITASGDLTINPAGGDLFLTNAVTFNVGGNATDVAYNVIGDTTAGASNVDSDDDLYVEGTLEVDGSFYAAGIDITSFACPDCIDFDDMEDTLDLDAGLTLNQGTNTWIQNFTGTTTTGLTYNANSLTTGSALNITTSSNPAAAGPVSPIQFNVTSTNATNATTFSAFDVGFTSNPSIAGNTEYVGQIQNEVTSNTTDNIVNALLRLDNADTSAAGSTVVTNALLITNSGDISAGITNGINLDDTDITTDIVFQNDETISNDTDGTLLLTATTTSLSSDLIVQGGDITLNTAGTIIPSGAGTITIGNSNLQALTVTTDGTGTNEVVLPTGAISSGEILDDTIVEVDLNATNGPTSGYILSYDAGGGFTWIDNTGGTGSSKWTNSGSLTYLTETTDSLTIGSSTELGKLAIDGDADEIQLLIQANATQTSNLLVAENSSGTDFFVINGTGGLTSTPSSTSDITLTTDADSTLIISGLSSGSGTSLCLDGSNNVITCASGSGSSTLQSAYDADANGSNSIIALTSDDDSLIFRNPASSGTDSAFTLQLDNIATGMTTSDYKNLYINNTGTINTTSGSLTNYAGYLSNTTTESAGSNTLTNVGLYVTASGGDTNYAAIFESGNVGIGDTSPTSLLTIGASDAFQINSSGNIVNIGTAAHSISNSAGALVIESATTGTVSIGSDASAETLNFGTGGAVKTVNVGSTNSTSATTIQSGTGDITFASQDDFFFTLIDGSEIDITGAASTAITGIIDTNIDSSVTGGFEVFNTSLTVNNGASAGDDFIAHDTTLTANDADADAFGLQITSAATANAGAGSYEALLKLVNVENTAGAVTDAILIDSTSATDTDITDAIDVSDDNIVNAINVGANIILGTTGNIDLSNFDVVGSTGDITTAGDIAINGGDITASGDLTINPTGGDLFLSNSVTFNVGGNATDVAYNVIGDSTAGASASMNSDDDLYIEGDLEVDGTITGSISASDVTCTDCLDFTDFENTLDVDETTDINLAANNLTIDLDSSGIFDIRDGATTYWSFDDDSTVDVTFPTAGFLTIDATATANTTTTGVIDLNIGAGNAAVIGQDIALTQNDGASAAVDAIAQNITLTANDADGDMFGTIITSSATANAGAGSYEALLKLVNVENTAGAVTDAILIDSTSATDTDITDAIDVADANITNAINVGQNFILADGVRGFSASSGNLTIEDTSGNDLLSLTDAGAITIGSSAVGTTAITLTTDSTGNAEVVLPNDAIGPDEILAAGQTDEYCLSYETTGDTWEWYNCTASGAFTSSGGIIDKTTAADRLRLQYGDAGDTQLEIDSTTNTIIPTVDAVKIDLSSGATNTGIVTDGVDGIFLQAEFGNGTTNTNAGIHLDIDPVNSPSGDELFYAMLIDGITGTSASETAISIGSGWDTGLAFSTAIGTEAIDLTTVAGIRTVAAIDINENNTTGSVPTIQWDSAETRGGFLDANLTGALGTENFIDITTSAAFTSNLISLTSGAQTASGNYFDINVGNAAQTGDIFNTDITANAVGLQNFVVTNAAASSTAGWLMDVNATGVFSAAAIDIDSTAAQTGSILHVDNSGNAAWTGHIIDVETGTGNYTGNIIDVFLEASTNNDGQVLVVVNDDESDQAGWLTNVDAQAAFTSSMIQFDSTTNDAWTGNIIDVDTGTGNVSGNIVDVNFEATTNNDAQFLVLANADESDQTGWLMDIDTSAAWTANMIDITTGAQATTGNFIDINLGNAAHTGDVINIDIPALAVASQALVISDASTAAGINIIDVTANGLTTGSVLGISSTSTVFADTISTGGGLLADFNWNPSSGSTTGTGDLVRIRLDDNGTLTSGNLFNIVDESTSIFSVAEAQITSAIPHQFTAAGDVAIAYDIQFTNQTSSFIKSYGPLTLEAGEIFESNPLTLRVYNAGGVVVDGSTDVNTGTGGVLDLNVNSTTTSNIGFNIDYISDSGVTAAADLFAANINITQNDTDGDLFGLRIDNEATSVTIAGTNLVDCLLCLNNSEAQAAAVLSAITIDGDNATSGAFTKGIDFDTTDITDDIELQNAETINNDTDGTVLIEDGGSTTLISTSTTTTSINLSAQVGGTAQRLCHGGADASTGVESIGDCGGTQADLAEYYSVLDDAREGNIVSLSQESYEIDYYGGKTTVSAVTKSTATYDNKIIGIVSTNPSGEVLGDAARPYLTNPKAIALIGRTPVKVTSENGQIKIGDFVTSSSIPGVGMKATEAGMVIGQALSSYDNSNPNEVGQIIIFVNPMYVGNNLAFVDSVNLDGTGNLTNQQDQIVSNSIDMTQYDSELDEHETRITLLEAQQASLSAELMNLKATVESSTSAQLTSILDSNIFNVLGSATESATLDDDFTVLGKTTLGETFITDDLRVGLLKFDDIEASIESLATPLKLQPTALSGIELLGGLINIDEQGNFVSQAQVTAKKYNVVVPQANAQGISQASIGQSTLWANTNTVLIETTQVTQNSKIFTSLRSSTGGQALIIDNIIPNESFTVNIEQSYSKDIIFDWWIVDSISIE